MSKKRSDSISTDEALVQLFFAGTGSVTKTARSLSLTIDKTREMLPDSLSLTPQELRKKVLTLFYQGKNRKQISRITGINISRVYKIIHAWQCLDNIEDINIIPHKPFPKRDEFQLLPIHRERLERLREEKVRKYRELNGETDI